MLTVYSVAATHVNDRLEEEEIVNASATLILINGAGALLGPILLGTSMSIFGQIAFMITPSVLCVLVLALAIFRIGIKDPVSEEDRGDHMVLAERTSYVTTEMAAEYSQYDEEDSKSS